MSQYTIKLHQIKIRFDLADKLERELSEQHSE